MPELPEVETFKNYGASKFLHRKIKKIEVDDERVLLVPKRALDQLKGKEFKHFHRRGKYVYIETSEKNLHLILHFGMTGYLKEYQKKEDRPAGTRVDFFMEHGCMAFVNPRKFGRVGLTDDIDGFFEEKQLAQDALSIDEKEFISHFEGRTGAIKSRLMDQKNVAGIGNIYADEILFQCEIHPETETDKIKAEELKKIFTTMKRVFKMAIKKKANYKEFPHNYLLFNRSLERSDPPLKQIKVGGRTTFYSPEKQRKR